MLGRYDKGPIRSVGVFVAETETGDCYPGVLQMALDTRAQVLILNHILEYCIIL